MDFCKMTQMLLIILGVFCLPGLSTGFRGPHHPNSHVSHTHAQPDKKTSFTHNTEVIHDIEHLKEDMGSLADKIDINSLPADQLDFYYFQIHDSDNNSKLDGLEMLQALQHIYEEEDHDLGLGNDPEEHENKLIYITEIIDNALKEHDLNGDGYLGYAEFKLSRNQGLL